MPVHKKLWLIAAVIALTLLLVGCAIYMPDGLLDWKIGFVPATRSVNRLNRVVYL